jgi:hypothetical protein
MMKCSRGGAAERLRGLPCANSWGALAPRDALRRGRPHPVTGECNMQEKEPDSTTLHALDAAACANTDVRLTSLPGNRGSIGQSPLATSP